MCVAHGTLAQLVSEVVMKARRFFALSAGSLVLAASAALGSAAWADDPTPAPSATSVEAVSCDATPVAADGSWSQKCSDGSSYVYNADGSWVNNLGNGCVISGDANGETSRVGKCPEENPATPGCWEQTGEDGTALLDADGNPLIVCADVADCTVDGPDTACPMMYSTGVSGGDKSGRDNCPQCRNFSGGPALASADGVMEKSAGGLNSDVLALDAAALDSAATGADQAAAIERAGANQPAVSMPGSGQSKGAGPIAPIAATVLGGGLVAAGVNVWRRMSVRGI